MEGFFDLEHVVLEAETHQIKTESIDAIVLRPNFQRIEHELEKHAMLESGTRATGAGIIVSIPVEPVVVSRDHLIEDGEQILARCSGMIVNHIHDDPEPDQM